MVDTGVVTDTDVPLKVKGSPMIRSLYIVDSLGGTKLLTFGLGQEVPRGGISAIVSAMPLKMKGMWKPKAKMSTRAGDGSDDSNADAAAAVEEEDEKEEEESASHITPPSGVTLSDFHAGEITGTDPVSLTTLSPPPPLTHTYNPHLQLLPFTFTPFNLPPPPPFPLPSTHLPQVWIRPHWSTLP